jgi:hypothetical protein
MNELPTEMVLAVLEWLDARGLFSAQRVCRLWRILCAKNRWKALWRDAYHRTWPPPLLALQDVPNEPIFWWALCRNRLTLERYSIPLLLSCFVHWALHQLVAGRGADEAVCHVYREKVTARCRW